MNSSRTTSGIDGALQSERGEGTKDRERLQKIMQRIGDPDPMTPDEQLQHYQEQRAASRREASRYVQERQQEARRARLERKFGHAGLPEKFQGKSLDQFKRYDPKIDRALQICSRYADNFERVRKYGACMSLIGIPGTGKTHAACSILETIIRAGYIGLFVSMSDILRAFRASYNGGGRSELETLEHFTEPDLLVIDEVGLAIGNLGKTRATLFDVLDRRYRDDKPVVLLGNLTDRELEDYLGERIYRRVQENNGVILAFDWEPYHRWKARQPKQ